MQTPEAFTQPQVARRLNQHRAQLSRQIAPLKTAWESFQEYQGLSELLEDHQREDQQALIDLLLALEKQVDVLEHLQLFSGKMDAENAFLDIQSGSGGTEAQDWAQMLLRMYLRFCERHGFQVELIECSPGEVAGIKSATLSVKGEYAFGWLHTETGVHRLVRKSPFDSGNRRHTSFAAVFVSPDSDDVIEVDINPSELRVDTYRASGAGGQHVNRTDSAVRITHLPTGIVVQCQKDRSQHKNRSQAMKQLQAKLYELALQKQRDEQQIQEASKSEIGWGNQIRSYVLDDSRIKDLRSGYETAKTQQILDGDLEHMILATLQQEQRHD